MKIRFNLMTAIIAAVFLSNYVLATENGECSDFNGKVVGFGSDGNMQTKIMFYYPKMLQLENDRLLVPTINIQEPNTSTRTETSLPDQPGGIFITTRADFKVDLPKVTPEEWKAARDANYDNPYGYDRINYALIPASRKLECRCFMKQAQFVVERSNTIISEGNLDKCSKI